jgi:hypothetical protein
MEDMEDMAVIALYMADMDAMASDISEENKLLIKLFYFDTKNILRILCLIYLIYI